MAIELQDTTLNMTNYNVWITRIVYCVQSQCTYTVHTLMWKNPKLLLFRFRLENWKLVYLGYCCKWRAFKFMDHEWAAASEQRPANQEPAQKLIIMHMNKYLNIKQVGRKKQLIWKHAVHAMCVSVCVCHYHFNNYFVSLN